MNFLWTTLHVSDMDASLAFYKDVVGLKEIRRFDSPTGNFIVFLGMGETKIELIYNPKDEACNMGESISIGFEVESLEQKMEDILSSGVSIYAGPIEPNPSIKFFYIKDPDGLKIQFCERN